MSPRCTYSTDEAGVMPGVSEGFQELISSLYGELTAMAAGSKQTIEVLQRQRKVTRISHG